MPTRRSGKVPAGFERDYYPLVAEPTLEATFVYLDGDFEDHEPAKTRKGKYRKGVHEWMVVETELDPLMLRREGFPIMTNDEGKKVFKIRAEVIVSYKGDQDVRIGWKIKARAGDKNAATVWEDQEKVWDGHYSQFIE